ncbi:MAG: hypothetical protein AAGJ35_11420, partial [Myxococcota bacterium]
MNGKHDKSQHFPPTSSPMQPSANSIHPPENLTQLPETRSSFIDLSEVHRPPTPPPESQQHHANSKIQRQTSAHQAFQHTHDTPRHTTPAPSSYRDDLFSIPNPHNQQPPGGKKTQHSTNHDLPSFFPGAQQKTLINDLLPQPYAPNQHDPSDEKQTRPHLQVEHTPPPASLLAPLLQKTSNPKPPTQTQSPSPTPVPENRSPEVLEKRSLEPQNPAIFTIADSSELHTDDLSEHDIHYRQEDRRIHTPQSLQQDHVSFLDLNAPSHATPPPQTHDTPPPSTYATPVPSGRTARRPHSTPKPASARKMTNLLETFVADEQQSTPQTHFKVRRGEKEFGPFSEEEIFHLLGERRLEGTEEILFPIQPSQSKEWIPLSTLPKYAELIRWMVQHPVLVAMPGSRTQQKRKKSFLQSLSRTLTFFTNTSFISKVSLFVSL